MERRPSANQSDNLRRNYQNLLYLETSRDEFLYKVHQELAIGEELDVETKVRSESFRGVEKDSESMFEQIRQVFLRLPRLETYDHHLLQTCLKIVDNEERRDSECNGAVVPEGRPKRWRQKCLDVIKSEVSKRTAETAPLPVILEEDKKDGGLLLQRLTKARDDILKDLSKAKALNDLFTGEWDMYNTYVMVYYENVMSQMQDRFSFDLNHTETVEVLSWMIYCRDRIFNCQDAECRACQMIVDQQNKFLREKEQHIHDWMENALKKDISDWKSENEPNANRLKELYTQFPLDILLLLEENISQAKHISPELHRHISRMCLKELDAIMDSYTDNAKVYINQEPPKTTPSGKGNRLSPTLHFKDLGKKTPKGPRPTHFVQYSVALLNNFDKITERLHKITTDDNDAGNLVEKDSTNNNNTRRDTEPTQELVKKIEAQTKDCSLLLLPKLLDDIRSELATLLTRNWLEGNGKEAVDTMCEVMASYLRPLREPLRTWLMPTIEEMVILGFAKGLTDKRVSLEGRERDRLDLSHKIYRECQQLQEFFHGFNKENGKDQTSADDSRWHVLQQMTEVVRAGDEETVKTEIYFLAEKYPDLTERHVRRLLRVRGDFQKAKIKTIVSSSMGKKKRIVKQGVGEKTIFSKLHLT